MTSLGTALVLTLSDTAAAGGREDLSGPEASRILEELRLEPRRYALVTLHRPSNVDNHAIFGGLLAIALNSDGLAKHVNLTVLGICTLVVVMGWMAGEIWAWARLRVPIYDLDGEVTA